MIRLTINFIREVIIKRTVIYGLAKRKFQQQYRGSYLGVIWTFLHPLLFILVLYFVFRFGIRTQSAVGDMPFGLYLICGMVCWLYFSSNLVNTTNVIREHSFLLKNVNFNLSILPLVSLLSSVIPHIFLCLVAVVMAYFQGFGPSFYLVQLAYYWFATITLLLGVGWMTASTSIFVTDVRRVVALFVQFGFWLTPIFWAIDLIPVRFQWVIKLNPVYYLVEGYRDSIVLGVPFWSKPELTLYFWVFTLVCMFLGTHIFRKLRPEFAELL